MVLHLVAALSLLPWVLGRDLAMQGNAGQLCTEVCRGVLLIAARSDRLLFLCSSCSVGGEKWAYNAWDEWNKTSDSTFEKLRKKCIMRPLGVVIPWASSQERCFLFGETNACFEGSTNKFATGKFLG